MGDAVDDSARERVVEHLVLAVEHEAGGYHDRALAVATAQQVEQDLAGLATFFLKSFQRDSPASLNSTGLM